MGFQQIHFDDISGKLMLLDNHFNFIIHINSNNYNYNKSYESKNKRVHTIQNKEKTENNRNASEKHKEENNYLNDKSDCKIKEINNNNNIILPVISNIIQQESSPLSQINTHGNHKTNKKEKVKNKLLKILNTYFKSTNKIKEFSTPNKASNFINKATGYISSPIKNDYTKFDRNTLIDKITKFLEEVKLKNKLNFDSQKIDPFNYALKNILKYLILNEDVYIAYSRKLDIGSPANNLIKKFTDLGEKIKELKSQEKIKEDYYLGNYNSYKNVNTFNYFESISKSRAKFNFSSSNEKIEDLSFLSNETNLDEEDDNMIKRYQKLQIKSLCEIQKIKEKEDKRINGFVYPIKNEYPKIHLDKSSKFSLKSNGEIYLKSMELLKRGILF